MDADTMESILSRLDYKMCFEKRQVTLFWDIGPEVAEFTW